MRLNDKSSSFLLNTSKAGLRQSGTCDMPRAAIFYKNDIASHFYDEIPSGINGRNSGKQAFQEGLLRLKMGL